MYDPKATEIRRATLESERAKRHRAFALSTGKVETSTLMEGTPGSSGPLEMIADACASEVGDFYQEIVGDPLPRTYPYPG